jgi:hypothetical protein
METAHFSETSASTNQSTRRLNPKEHRHNRQQGEDLKSQMTELILNVVVMLIGRGCKGNIKINFQELWCDNMNWVQMAQDTGQWPAVMNSVMDLREA